jgi:hypothetical protein
VIARRYHQHARSVCSQTDLLSDSEPNGTDAGEIQRRFEMRSVFLLWLACGIALFSSYAHAQSDNSSAIPEMARLAKVLAGNWSTVKIVQHGKPVPEGQGRLRDRARHLGRRRNGAGPKVVPLARSEETYAGSLRSGGTRTRSSIAFSPASKRLPVASCAARRIGMATHSLTTTRTSSTASAPKFRIVGPTLDLIRTH